MGENTNMFFERWLAAYGNRLEELAGNKVAGPGGIEPPPQDIGEAQNGQQDEH